MVKLRYIVTGTGRSGTVGLAAPLSSAGIPTCHERFFSGNSPEEALYLMQTNGRANSLCSQYCGLSKCGDRVVAESSYMAAPFLGAACFASTTVVHAVRNPWKVILSFLNGIQFFRGEPERELFISSVLTHVQDVALAVDRAARYYIEPPEADAVHDDAASGAGYDEGRVSQVPHLLECDYRVFQGTTRREYANAFRPVRRAGPLLSEQY
jgi:hypothetical protein